MRRLYFGGSFNPIHAGHLITARAVAEAARFDVVTLVPSRISPHKKSADSPAIGDRLEMCRRSVVGDAVFEVSDIEADRPGPSYTIDTADELRRRGATEVYWLVGADMAVTLPTWHDATRLLQQVKFILMARPGWSLLNVDVPVAVQPLVEHVVPAPLLDISSTDIRRRVAEGRSIAYLTPPAVVEYIARRGLYQSVSTQP